MRAIQIAEFGGPEVMQLAELPVPEPGDGEVLIEVSRSGINFADTHQRENSYLSRFELPLVPGGEVAGVVERGTDELPGGRGLWGWFAAAATPSTRRPRRSARFRSPTASATGPRSRCRSRASP